MKKILLLIFDGLSDRPIPELSEKTPLEFAKTPNLDKLAKKGVLGLQNALPVGEYPTSEEAHLSIFGYDYKKDLPGRGVLEALGIGVDLKKKELALRVDFGTVDEGFRVIDPRAGNIKSVESFCHFLKEEKIGPFTFRLYPSLAHRAVLVISGDPVSKEISHHSTVVSDTDPHKAKVHHSNKLLKPQPLNNSPEAKMTADALWEYQLLTHKKLNSYIENRVRKRTGHKPANFILTRGAGYLKNIENFHDKYNLNAVCVAGAPLYKGIAKYLGMDVVAVKGATGGIDTDVNAKLQEAIQQLESGYDFAFVHLKGADVVAEEEGSWEKKIAFFEKADLALSQLLGFKGVLCVTGDHSTPCVLKDHSDDPVPLMIIGNKRDEIGRFDEFSAEKGSLGHLSGREIMSKLIKEAKNV